MGGGPEYFIGDRLFELPGFPLLEEGEAFQSLAWRTSAANSIGQSLAIKILALAEVAENPQAVEVRRTYLVRPALTHSPSQKDAIGASFLSSLATNCIRVLRLDEARQLGLREQVRVSSTLICPQCLGEEPAYFRLEWKVGSVFMCVRHGRLLSQVCPGCELPHGIPRHDGGLLPIQSIHVGSVHTCMNPAPVGSDRAKARLACGHDLRSISAPTITDREVVKAQQYVLEVLRRSDAFELRPGVLMAPLEFFDDLRALCRLVMFASPASLADGLCEPLAAEWKEYCSGRDADLAGRQGKKGANDHSMVGVPSPALIAVAVTHAISILTAPAEDEFNQRLAALLEFVVVREPKAAIRARQDKRISPVLRLGLIEATIEEGQVLAYLRNHPAKGRRLDFRHFEGHITPEFIREMLPEVCGTVDPAHFVEPFLIMLRFFCSTSASVWSDVIRRDDPEASSSRLLRLINVAAEAGSSRKLARLVAEVACSVPEYSVIAYTTPGQKEGSIIRWQESEARYDERKQREAANRPGRWPKRKSAIDVIDTVLENEDRQSAEMKS